MVFSTYDTSEETNLFGVPSGTALEEALPAPQNIMDAGSHAHDAYGRAPDTDTASADKERDTRRDLDRQDLAARIKEVNQQIADAVAKAEERGHKPKIQEISADPYSASADLSQIAAQVEKAQQVVSAIDAHQLQADVGDDIDAAAGMATLGSSSGKKRPIKGKFSGLNSDIADLEAINGSLSKHNVADGSHVSHEMLGKIPPQQTPNMPVRRQVNAELAMA